MERNFLPLLKKFLVLHVGILVICILGFVVLPGFLFVKIESQRQLEQLEQTTYRLINQLKKGVGIEQSIAANELRSSIFDVWARNVNQTTQSLALQLRRDERSTGGEIDIKKVLVSQEWLSRMHTTAKTLGDYVTVGIELSKRNIFDHRLSTYAQLKDYMRNAPQDDIEKLLADSETMRTRAFDGDILRETYINPVLRGSEYIFYAIKEDGNIIIPRKERFSARTLEWREYYQQLLSEMSAKKEGTISYPTRSFWQFYKGKNIIQYRFIEELGWIVAVEGSLESDLILFKKIFVAKSSMYFIGLLLFVFFIVQLITHRFIKQAQGTASDAQKEIFREKICTDDVSDYRTRERQRRYELIAATNREQISFRKTLDKELHELLTFPESGETEKDISFLKQQALSEREPQVQQTKKHDTDYSDMTLKAKGIKSPLLQKMISEMRKQQ
ncbi:MAG: hypothetical protein KKH94_11265 [Candidatus Omnitrophica bacterium]|nr:hypothetical protein [Candidatus Omnitrophota bacterium]